MIRGLKALEPALARKEQTTVNAFLLALSIPDTGFPPWASEQLRQTLNAQEFADGIRTCLDDEHEFEYDRWGAEGLPKVDPLWHRY